MMEIPSAALLSEEIAQEVDFLSIGSNDLTQYTLACDRTNYRVAKLYNPLHPSVLRLIKQIINGGHRKRRWVGCCGELAMKPIAIPILIGLGVDELSVAPIYVLEVKKVIREISKEEAKEIANKVVEMKSSTEVKEYLEKVKERIPVLKEVMKLK
jgi:phosphotransferase system enzyme I (PtsI)